jgi:uridine nucleosidase
MCSQGLGGVEGLPGADHSEIQQRLGTEYGSSRAIAGISAAIRDTWKQGAGPQVTIISTGPMTNVALFVSVYPELLPGVEEFVFMGGGVGIGNRSASAEFNILCDREFGLVAVRESSLTHHTSAEAAQIVLDAPVKTVSIGLQ